MVLVLLRLELGLFSVLGRKGAVSVGTSEAELLEDVKWSSVFG